MLLRDLRSASYKGARFLVPEDHAEVGRNSILHRFPDSNLLYAEDNGGIAPIFEIQGLVHGDGLPGKVAALRRAFFAPGPGLLRHPWFGNQFCAVDGTAKFSRSDRDAGVVEFSVKLVVTGPPVFPGIASGIPAVVSGLSAQAVTDAFLAYATEIGVATSGRSSIELASAIADITSTISDEFGSGAGIADAASYDAGRLAADPDKTASTLAAAFREPMEVDSGVSNEDLVAGFGRAFDVATVINDRADSILASTTDLAWRREALKAFARAAEAASYASLAESMVARTYETADQVEEAEGELISRFDLIQSRSLTDALADMLGSVMTAASEVLRDQAVRLPRIETVNVRHMPASVLSYLLYHGDTSLPTSTEDYVPKLIALNRDLSPALLHGDITILSSEA